MHKRARQEQHHPLSPPQTKQFHNPCRPANSAFANKSHKITRSFNNHNCTRTPSNSYTYSHNQILPYFHSMTSRFPTQILSNPHHQDTISVHSTIPYNHPPTMHNTTTKMTPIAKIEPNT